MLEVTVVDAKTCQPMNMVTAIQLETVILDSGLLDGGPGVAVLMGSTQQKTILVGFFFSLIARHRL